MHTFVVILIWFASFFYLTILTLSAITYIKNKKKIIYREDGAAYLVRYKLIGCKWFKIRVHHILLSDHDCLHDHPWNFISIILKGGYWERRWPIINKNFYKWYSPCSLLYRKATWRHSIELPVGRTCWTFVIMFRRKREWGFWTKSGFVHWRKYNSNQNCE